MIASVLDDNDPHSGRRTARRKQNNKISHISASTQTQKSRQSKEKHRMAQCPTALRVSTVTGNHWKATEAGNSTNLIHRSENKS